MKSLKIIPRSAAKRAAVAVVLAAAALTAAACGHLAMMGSGASSAQLRRRSASGRAFRKGKPTRATLQPVQPLRLRRLQSVPVLITDTQGRPVESAVISVDGGMPEHGHGLPTQPRVTALGSGMYQIEGLRFSMGGWWQLKLAIDASAGADRITFNLSL